MVKLTQLRVEELARANCGVQGGSVERDLVPCCWVVSTRLLGMGDERLYLVASTASTVRRQEQSNGYIFLRCNTVDQPVISLLVVSVDFCHMAVEGFCALGRHTVMENNHKFLLHCCC